MENTKFQQLKNFLVYLSAAAFLSWSLWLLKAYLHGAVLHTGAASMLVLSAKFFVKFLPLMAALFAGHILSHPNSFTLHRLFSLNKSRRVDLYCFALTHLHKVIGLLTMVFTLGIPFYLDRLIANIIPSQMSLFAVIEKFAGWTSAVLVFILIASLFSYWEHRLWHTRVMWPIHRFHHSATDYNPLIESRKHFTEVLMTPLFFTLPIMLLGAPVEFVVTYLSLILFQGFMIHTDLQISYGWIGRMLWVDPVYHKLHHSSAPEHMNTNFSGTLPIWDRLFGTYIYEERPVAVGVAGTDHYLRLPYWKIYIQDFSDFRACLRDAIGRVRLTADSGV